MWVPVLLPGVALAIAMGGPGAVFWMWVIAAVGAASAFAESLLGQLYKERGKDSYIGGPAYYMKRGLNAPWMGYIFVAFICGHLRVCVCRSSDECCGGCYGELVQH